MGYEASLVKRDCHDCKVKPGELHVAGCDAEQCPVCGCQAISCGHGKDVLDPENKLWKKRLPWSGISYGVEEAVEYNYFARWDDHCGPRGGGRWVVCDKAHPDAVPCASDVLARCRWDPKLKKFVQRPR